VRPDERFSLEDLVTYVLNWYMKLDSDKFTKEDVTYSKHKLDELNRRYLATELKDLKLLK